MKRFLGRWTLSALILTGGCHWLTKTAPYEEDPLLSVRQAVEDKPLEGELVRVPLQAPLIPNPPPPLWKTAPVESTPVLPQPTPIEPTPAPTPSDQLPLPTPIATVDPEPEPDEGPHLIVPVAAITESVHKPMTVEIPRLPEPTAPTAFVESAKMPEPDKPESTTPEPGHRVEGKYGHGENYEWLQGEVDRHYRGHISVRYADPSTSDRWGGKVHLLDDPRLAHFKNGDIIYLEGELLPDEAPPELKGESDYPAFRVRNVKLINDQP